MATWELIGYNTDMRYRDVYHREYTTSEAKAKEFEKIPKIQFTDSGHGYVFEAHVHTGKRKEIKKSEYVAEQLALMKAPWVIQNFIKRKESEHARTREHWQTTTAKLRHENAELRHERSVLYDRISELQNDLDAATAHQRSV